MYFDQEKNIAGKTFIKADFGSVTGKIYSVILDKDSGSPLHLQGLGFRNELASEWLEYTLDNEFFIGENRIVGVKTISEDLKEDELLFSVQQLVSWLPFFDDYLPIFKQIIEVPDNVSETWNYHLIELREISKNKEYIAVEKVAPYRILADKKSGEHQPRIVKSKSKSIKSPEELNAIQRFFSIANGRLVDIQ